MERFVKYNPSTFEVEGIYQNEIDNSIKLPIDYARYNNIIDALKAFKLDEIKKCIDVKYKKYLAKYPEVEVKSFQDKAKEALLVKKDSNTALEDTPYLSALANNDIDARNALADAVNTKVIEAAQLEANGVKLRDTIKNATTIEELQNIQCV
jgi:hypothetical protein